MPLKEPHKVRVYIDELEEMGLDYLEYNGLPFNGYAVYDYFKPEDNAAIEVEGEIEYRDGFKKGWDIEYYPNGNIKIEMLRFFETPLLVIEYNELGIEIYRSRQVSLEDYDDMIEKYNILDK
ncbi:MAG: hypothetical protein V4613_02760 [Bacteroidota bacterium]